MGCQRSKEKSKISIPSNSVIVDSAVNKKKSKINRSPNSVIIDLPLTPPTLLAWSSQYSNEISVIDLETKQNYVTFYGARISNTYYSWTHVKAIPNTKLLVSLHHNREKSANMEIFDVSKKGKANRIYSLGEVSGSKLVVGHGDVTYNSRRGILGVIPVGRRVAYHMFTIDTSASSAKEMVKLNRKSKWHSQHSTQKNYIFTGFDFDPAGEFIATIDSYGMCLISDVDTNDYGFHLQLGSYYDDLGRCRWSPNISEPLLFVKYDWGKLNILDVEKKTLTLRDSAELHRSGFTHWIDVCQGNANLLASAGSQGVIKIFDKRESKVVKTFERTHPGAIYGINCVRWNPSGDMLANGSSDKTAKLFDFKTGKVLHTSTISDRNGTMSVCFI